MTVSRSLAKMTQPDVLLEQHSGMPSSLAVPSPIEPGATTFMEVGPGKVLTGLMCQIDRAQTATNVEDEASMQRSVEALAGRANPAQKPR
jgi:[acyl-carrier-protein] S-malonyltransferase